MVSCDDGVYFGHHGFQHVFQFFDLVDPDNISLTPFFAALPAMLGLFLFLSSLPPFHDFTRCPYHLFDYFYRPVDKITPHPATGQYLIELPATLIQSVSRKFLGKINVVF